MFRNGVDRSGNGAFEGRAAAADAGLRTAASGAGVEAFDGTGVGAADGDGGGSLSRALLRPLHQPAPKARGSMTSAIIIHARDRRSASMARSPDIAEEGD
jgi:hypothetical protein